MTQELSLPDQLLLLCLNDATGYSDERWAGLGLAGAVLAELILRDRVAVEEKDRLVIRDPAPMGDPVLDGALARIRESGSPRTIRDWVAPGRLVRDDFIRAPGGMLQAVAAPLVERGVLTEKEERFLWIFPHGAYPTHDVQPEAALRERLRAALLGSGAVDERLTVLIALLHASQALDRVLTADEAAGAASRVRECCEAVAAGKTSSGAVRGHLDREHAVSTYLFLQGLAEIGVSVAEVGLSIAELNN